MTTDTLPTLTPSLAAIGAANGVNLDTNPDAHDGAHPGAVRWLTIPEAAAHVGAHPRTVRRWASTGRVVSRMEERDGHPVKLIREDTIPDTKADARDGSKDGVRPDAHDGAQGGSGDGAHPGAQDGALRDRLHDLIADNQFLRDQLRLRAVELERRDQAEAELRRLLLASQQALSLALERPMLPAAPEVLPVGNTEPATPKQARWWAPWKRR